MDPGGVTVRSFAGAARRSFGAGKSSPDSPKHAFIFIFTFSITNKYIYNHTANPLIVAIKTFSCVNRV
jgi:hypothetical protein